MHILILLLSSALSFRLRDNSCDDTNVLGNSLESCSTSPVTGFLRDGCCTYVPEDGGAHLVCATLT